MTIIIDAHYPTEEPKVIMSKDNLVVLFVSALIPFDPRPSAAGRHNLYNQYFVIHGPTSTSNDKVLGKSRNVQCLICGIDSSSLGDADGS